jgi:hypothetical protein
MEVYQLRLFEKSLEALCDEIAGKVWPVVAKLAGARGARGHAAVREAVWDVLTKHLHRFEECGAKVFCDEGVFSRPLTSSRQTADERTDPNLRADATRYHFRVPQTLSAFLEAMSFAIWSHLAREKDFEGRMPDAATRRRALGALRSALAPYVYYNTECGTRWECQHAHERALVGDEGPGAIHQRLHRDSPS